jgi:hypothetical protein
MLEVCGLTVKQLCGKTAKLQHTSRGIHVASTETTVNSVVNGTTTVANGAAQRSSSSVTRTTDLLCSSSCQPEHGDAACSPVGRHRAMWNAMTDIDERFAAYVRDRGEHHLRAALLLSGDWHAAEDLVQASLAKRCRAVPKLRLDGDPDAHLRRIMVNTQRSWWRARWRRESPAGELPETVISDFADVQLLGAQGQGPTRMVTSRARASAAVSSRP